ncbi:hypothetical protein Vadar_018822 [Vaccinium darrowii]|uniref:Uncharacterized protein n=1 Tax=Vaccinium darrowii TaxID=229202 RepID=A0ACB7XRJ7_9ERIC|nr:hypothetical protein Vadar_018822 [Vaccinium darrowii]
MKRDMNQNPDNLKEDGLDLGDILAGSAMEYIYQSNPKDPPYIWYKGGGSKMKKIPSPMRTWADECRLAPELLRAVERTGYKKPHPFRRQPYRSDCNSVMSSELLRPVQVKKLPLFFPC